MSPQQVHRLGRGLRDSLICHATQISTMTCTACSRHGYMFLHTNPKHALPSRGPELTLVQSNLFAFLLSTLQASSWWQQPTQP